MTKSENLIGWKYHLLWLWETLKLFLCVYLFIHIKAIFLYCLSFSYETDKTAVFVFDILTPTIAMLF